MSGKKDGPKGQQQIARYTNKVAKVDDAGPSRQSGEFVECWVCTRRFYLEAPWLDERVVARSRLRVLLVLLAAYPVE